MSFLLCFFRDVNKQHECRICGGHYQFLTRHLLKKEKVPYNELQNWVPFPLQQRRQSTQTSVPGDENEIAGSSKRNPEKRIPAKRTPRKLNVKSGKTVRRKKSAGKRAAKAESATEDDEEEEWEPDDEEEEWEPDDEEDDDLDVFDELVDIDVKFEVDDYEAKMQHEDVEEVQEKRDVDGGEEEERLENEVEVEEREHPATSGGLLTGNLLNAYITRGVALMQPPTQIEIEAFADVDKRTALDTRTLPVRDRVSVAAVTQTAPTTSRPSTGCPRTATLPTTTTIVSTTAAKVLVATPAAVTPPKTNTFSADSNVILGSSGKDPVPEVSGQGSVSGVAPPVRIPEIRNANDLINGQLTRTSRPMSGQSDRSFFGSRPEQETQEKERTGQTVKKASSDVSRCSLQGYFSSGKCLKCC